LKENYAGGLITAYHSSLTLPNILSNLVNDFLKNGKAAGLDDITAEHLKFSHPYSYCCINQVI
jgi:hypothetical protein